MKKTIVDFLITMFFQVSILCIINHPVLSSFPRRLIWNVVGLFVVECYAYWKYNK